MNQSNLNALGDGKSPDMLVFSMRMCVVMLMLFLLPFDVFCTQGGMNGDFRESIPTLYPTKDWVVSDFVVTDSRFGAKAEPGFDNRAAFQAAIDAAYQSGGRRGVYTGRQL